MSSRLAIVRRSDALVINAIKADPLVYVPPAGHDAVQDDAGTIDIGGTYINGVFTPQPVPAPVVIDWAAVDAAAMNEALAQPGSVVRALGLLMLDEINRLRAKDGDAAYTLTQFKTALVAKMR